MAMAVQQCVASASIAGTVDAGPAAFANDVRGAGLADVSMKQGWPWRHERRRAVLRLAAEVAQHDLDDGARQGRQLIGVRRRLKGIPDRRHKISQGARECHCDAADMEAQLRKLALVHLRPQRGHLPPQ